MTLTELLEARQNAANLMVELRDKISKEGRAFTPEERSAWEKVNVYYDSLNEQIDVMKRAQAVESEVRQMMDNGDVPGRGDAGNGGNSGESDDVVTEETRATAFQGFIRMQLTGDVSDAQRSAMRSVGINGNLRELPIQLSRSVPTTMTEARVLGTNPNAAGGFLVPVTLVRALEVAMLQFGGIRNLATVMRTATGAPLGFPTANDTGNEGVQVGEASDIGTDDSTPFGMVNLDVFKFSSKIIKVPYELLEDSAFNLVAFLGRMIGERLGRVMSNKCTNGSGNNTVKGLLPSATAFNSKAVGTFTADDLISLTYEVDQAYRSNGAFMMHDKVLKMIRLMKDGNGQYLFQPALTAGTPDMFNGFKIQVNNHMPSAIETGKAVVTFGDHSKYMIREAGSMRLKRLTERFAEEDVEGFVGLHRFGGNLLDAGTHPVKKLVIK